MFWSIKINDKKGVNSVESRVPEHIAIMMDGNGRWGKQRGMTRSQGHYAGSKAMENIINVALELGIRVLTLYAFSTENWTRPKKEVKYLMDLPAKYLKEKLPEYKAKNISIRISGDIDGLPKHTAKAVNAAVSETRGNDKLIVNFALNYGGKNEVITAVKSILRDIQDERVTLEEVDPKLMDNYLYTSGLPDPDIIIRTGGEQRISNFLLWQSANSRLWYTDTYFPDFTKELLIQAIEEAGQGDGSSVPVNR
ncbi:isoprenyl transferase [Virgibacillus flavescens]|uniref:isoprenyl transferase n=1 Tax=Virgibacillus flavescens TaxID=1611422 RepID=UPI003D3511A4